MYTYIQTGDNKNYRAKIHGLIFMNDLLHISTHTMDRQYVHLLHINMDKYIVYTCNPCLLKAPYLRW